MQAKPYPVEAENRLQVLDKPKKLGQVWPHTQWRVSQRATVQGLVPVEFLDTSHSGGRNMGSLGCQLYPWSLASRRFECGFLGTAHVALSVNQQWLIHSAYTLALLLWMHQNITCITNFCIYYSRQEKDIGRSKNGLGNSTHGLHTNCSAMSAPNFVIIDKTHGILIYTLKSYSRVATDIFSSCHPEKDPGFKNLNFFKVAIWVIFDLGYNQEKIRVCRTWIFWNWNWPWFLISRNQDTDKDAVWTCSLKQPLFERPLCSAAGLIGKS